ncbi:MAG: S8 family serine peptidase [Bacteriovoracaceae bacterium]|nr:S8 family serine peptidase [Bacteriovoracaceae bacterium]
MNNFFRLPKFFYLLFALIFSCSYSDKGGKNDNAYDAVSIANDVNLGGADQSIVTALPAPPANPADGSGTTEFDNPLNARIVTTGTTGNNISCMETTSTTSPWPWNDPYSKCQWHFGNLGQKVPLFLPYQTGGGFFARGNTGADLNLYAFYTDQTFQNIRGSGVKVHITDSGMDVNNRDFGGRVNLSESRDLCRAGSNNPTPTNDENKASSSGAAHGTGVAGIIAANANNNWGVAGIAPEVSISADNLISYCRDTANIMDWINILGSQKSQIWNGSFGSNTTSITHSTASDGYDMINAAVSITAETNKKSYFKAAGNEGYDYKQGDANRDPFSRNIQIGVIGALTGNGKPATYSNPGANLLVSAFGGNDASNRAGITTLGLNEAIISSFNGTSAATPMVSAVAALMVNANPSLRYQDVQYILARTATPLDLTAETTNGSVKITNTSVNAAGYYFNRYVGFGAVDAYKAIKMAKSPSYKLLPDVVDYPQLLKTGNSPVNFSANKSCAIKKITVPSNSQTSTFQIFAATVSFDIRFQDYKSETDKLGNVSIRFILPDGTRSQIVAPSQNLVGSRYSLKQEFLSRALMGTMAVGSYFFEVCAVNTLRDTPFLFYSAQLKLSGFTSKSLTFKSENI